MTFPIDMVGKPCVMIAYRNDAPSFIGEYNEKGECVIRLGSYYARPAEWFDLKQKPKDQNYDDAP